MSKRAFRISISILAVLIGVLVWMNVIQSRRQTWDVSYQMVNSRVEWTGAGYNGIYGR